MKTLNGKLELRRRISRLNEPTWELARLYLNQGDWTEEEYFSLPENFMLTKNRQRVHEEYWDGADLAMEVVSKDSKGRKRDLVTKRSEYAKAGIAEYLIVDPKLKQVTVLWLNGKKYEVHGVFKPEQRATSRLLEGFGVEVESVFEGP